jgi:SlyX protein
MTREPESQEARIVELETRQAFQEHTVEELNGVLISQQQQIDRLESQLVRLQKKFAELSSGSGEPGIHGP